jgi:hypothetical protein
VSKRSEERRIGFESRRGCIIFPRLLVIDEGEAPTGKIAWILHPRLLLNLDGENATSKKQRERRGFSFFRLLLMMRAFAQSSWAWKTVRLSRRRVVESSRKQSKGRRGTEKVSDNLKPGFATTVWQFALKQRALVVATRKFEIHHAATRSSIVAIVILDPRNEFGIP